MIDHVCINYPYEERHEDVSLDCYKCDGIEVRCHWYYPNKMTNKHQDIVDRLQTRLSLKRYVDDVVANELYPKGDLDVKSIQGNRDRRVIYEVKSRHTEKLRRKAIKQMLRATRYYHNHNHQYDFVGVYIVPGLFPERICKNGVMYK